jgi:hypothetical protein
MLSSNISGPTTQIRRARSSFRAFARLHLASRMQYGKAKRSTSENHISIGLRELCEARAEAREQTWMAASTIRRNSGWPRRVVTSTSSPDNVGSVSFAGVSKSMGRGCTMGAGGNDARM